MPSFSDVVKHMATKRVRENIPYVGSGVESLGVQVSAILKVETEAQRIVLDVSKPYILLEKLVPDDKKGEEQTDAYEYLVSHVPMREFAPDEKVIKSPYEYMNGLFRQITDESLEVVLILVGNLRTLDAWIQVSPKNRKLYGVPVRQLKKVPDDVIILCGAEWRDADPEDVKLTVKGTMS